MNKYIVKNCENCFYRGNGEYFCEFQNENIMFINPCKNSTCLLKKIIEKCKKEVDPTQEDWTRDKENLAEEILELLELEECEE